MIPICKTNICHRGRRVRFAAKEIVERFMCVTSKQDEKRLTGQIARLIAKHFKTVEHD
jgi:hypothetical protein